MHRIIVLKMRWKILALALVIVFTVSAIVVVNEIKSKEDIVLGTGTVTFLAFEGGFYGIVGDDGEHYDPLNMAQEFKSDGLRVYFEARILRDTVSFHMWGKIVSILKIHKLE